jgi:hypothetical protein
MPDDRRPDVRGPDVAEALLELRDEVVGIQAQLDELRARLDDLERADGAPRGLFARLRTRGSRRAGAPPPSAT